MTCLTRTGLSTYAFLVLAFAAAASAADSLPATINLAAPDDQQSTGAPGNIQTAPGQWDILAGHPNDDVAADLAKFDGWTKAAVPGGFWPPGNPSCCWAMRRFKAPADGKGGDCEILFERVQWSATVWLNGQKLGNWPDGYSPFRLIATKAIRPGEENVLVVRIGGFAEVPKSKSGKPLFPAGFAMAGQGGGGGIMGRVFVRFFNKVRITRLQVLPDIAKSTANVIVRVEGGAPEALVRISALELGKMGPAPTNDGEAPIKLTNGAGEAIVAVKIKDAKLWEPGKPFLYLLHAYVNVGQERADFQQQRFGMREVVCKPDGFYLNGHKVALFGWNGFGDQLFWRANPALFSREKFREAIIAGAKAMNAVCVRTHTGPWPTWVLDMCDEEGLLVLSEFAVTVNCGKIDLDDKEFAAWQTDMEMEAGAVVPYLANHPSIVMWVMTNESNNWHEYERGRLFQHFKKLDPSRPTIRAAYDTPEARDIHSYAAMWKGSDGDFAFRCKIEAARAAHDKMPVMCTEYLGGMGGQVTRKWFGPDADTADPAARKRLAANVSQFWAFRCMEQTEAVRRMGYSCILPFGYFGGVGPNTPKDPPPAPAQYAIPSALAPVGVSVDLDNKHFLADQEHKTDIYVMNDTDAKVSAKVTVVLTTTDPGFDPEAPLPKAVWQQELDVPVAAHSREIKTVQWKAPAEEGLYYLLARLDRDGAKPVTSHRLVYSLKRDPTPAALAGKRVLVIEEPDKKGVKKLSNWVSKLGCKLVDPSELPTGFGPAFTQPDLPLVIVAPRVMKVTPDGKAVEPYKTLADRLLNFCTRGGHAVVLEQFAWPTKPRDACIVIERTDYDFNDNNAPADMAGVTTAGPTTRADDVMADVSETQASGGTSRVFRWEQPDRAIWKGIPNEYLYNWNGYHGRVARVSMSTYPGRGRILVKYAEAERDDIKFVPVVAAPTGLGELLYFMLQVDGRYDPADPDYDPVVERLMVNLLRY